MTHLHHGTSSPTHSPSCHTAYIALATTYTPCFCFPFSGSSPFYTHTWSHLQNSHKHPPSCSCNAFKSDHNGLTSNQYSRQRIPCNLVKNVCKRRLPYDWACRAVHMYCSPGPVMTPPSHAGDQSLTAQSTRTSCWSRKAGMCHRTVCVT